MTHHVGGKENFTSCEQMGHQKETQEKKIESDNGKIVGCGEFPTFFFIMRTHILSVMKSSIFHYTFVLFWVREERKNC